MEVELPWQSESAFGLARIAAGMTQTELAEATDIPYQTIGHWERNSTSPKFDSVEKIAKALGITVAELISPDSCQSDAATARNNLYKKIDDELRKTEESDIEMYVHGCVSLQWSKKSSQRSPPLLHQLPGVSPWAAKRNGAGCESNDTIEKVTNYIVDCEMAGREIHPNVEDGLDAMLQLRRQMATEYELE